MVEQSVKCGNCGVYRAVHNGLVQKCPYCGDDEYDLNDPDLYEAIKRQEQEYIEMEKES